MAVTFDAAAQRKAYWPVPIVRAIPAAALALGITFSAEHSARFGLLTFGGFAVVSGILIGVMSWLRLAGSRARSFFVAQAIVTLVAGVLALAFTGAGVTFLFFLLTAFALITGFLELYSGIRSRRRFVASTDWITVGGLTVLAAIAFLLIPPDYSQSFHDPDGVDRVLDSGVVVVGFVGAYAAILAVFLLIAGFSAKWGTQPPRPDAVTEPSTAESETTA